MQPLIAYAKLPISYDLSQIQNNVNALNQHWMPHFNAGNYTGSWDVLPLRSPGGDAREIVPDLRGKSRYHNTLLMLGCSDIMNLVDHFQCEVMAVRLMRLSAGASIRQHTDPELYYERGEVRIHFPVITNKEVAFYVEDQRVQMEEGSAWYMNANLPHRVDNQGKTDRIHLVMDCKVNDWLREIFARSELVLADIPRQIERLRQMICGLREQEGPAATRLIEQLQDSIRELSHIEAEQNEQPGSSAYCTVNSCKGEVS